jgi:hypothetical protein
MIVINPDSYTWYESSRFRLQTNVALNGQIEVAYYGYGALAVKVAEWFLPLQLNLIKPLIVRASPLPSWPLT